MKPMQQLDFLEQKFENSSNKTKIELFIFPFLLFFLFFFLYEEENSFEAPSLKATFNKKTQINFKSVDIIKDIEEYMHKEKIKLIKLSNIKNRIDLEASAHSTKQIKLLNFIENYNAYSKITSLKIEDKNIKIIISFDKKYIKRTNKKVNEKLKLLEEYVDYAKKFKLNAIIADSVLINNKWFKIEDKIDDNFKLIKIRKEGVSLKSKETIVNLRLYDE